MRSRGFGVPSLTMAEKLAQFPVGSPTRYKWQTSISNAGNNDGPTVPANRRARIVSSELFVTGGVALGALMLKRGGSYYQLSSLTAQSSANAHAFAGFIFEAADTIAVNHSAFANIANYCFDIEYFDAPSSGPRGLFTAVNTALSSGNNTIVTCAADCSIVFPVLGSLGTASIGHVMNNSGGNIALSMYKVPSGGTADGTNIMRSLTAQATGARATLTPCGQMDAGDYLVINTDTAGNQVGWVTCFEGSF